MGGTNSTASGDDGTQFNIAIPTNGGPAWTFSYNGVAHSAFGIGTNGWIRLGSSTTIGSFGAFGNGFNTTNNNDLVAALWDDNNRSTGSISYATSGTTPNRVLTIQWSNTSIGGGGSSSNATNNYQVKLFETTNVIQICYGALTSANGITASIGLQGTGNNFMSVTPGVTPTTSTVTANNNITSVAGLPSGTIYTFTPPPPPACPAPSAVTVTALSATTASVSWTGAATAVVEWGTSGCVAGTAGTAGACGNVVTGSSPQTITGLTFGSSYSVYVRQDCTGSSNGYSTNTSAAYTHTAGESCTVADFVTVYPNSGAAVNTLLTTGTTADGPPGTCSDATGNPNKKDRWVKFVAPSNGNKLVITTVSGSLTDMVMQVWSSCPGVAPAMGCSDDVNGLMPELQLCQNQYVGGQTYWVQMWPYSATATGNWNIKIYEDVACPVPPSNDECAGEVPLTIGAAGSCPGAATAGTTVNATASAGVVKTTCDQFGTYLDVFYTFNSGPNTALNLAFASLTGSCEIGLYDGCGTTYLGVCSSSASFNTTLTGLTTNTNYRIIVWSNPGATGTFTVCLSQLPVPACVASPTAPTNGGVSCAGGATTLSWPAVASATNYDVYLDAGAGPATTLVSADQTGTTYAAGVLAAGAYSWRVVPKNISGSATGCSDFTFTVTAAPAGDVLATAIPVTLSPAGSGSVSGNNQASNCFTNNIGNTSADVFYSFTTGPCANAATATVGICTSSYDSFIRIFDATGATELASDDDDCTAPNGTGSIVLGTEFSLAPNTTYIVVVEGFGSNEGTYTLAIYDGSPDGDTDGFADCVDNCPATANAGQEDTDGDQIGDACDVCPLGPNPGSACNDGNPFTTGDVIQGNCSCAGTPGPSTTWSLEFTTDNAGSESTWQIVDASSPFVLASGGPYASNTTTTIPVTVPTGACFNLIVTDANGMSNGTTGGWVLRDNTGKRVIDNAGDGVFAGTVQAPLPFCSPVGNDVLLLSKCDKVDWLPTGIVIATPNTAVQAEFGIGNQADDGYEFWFFNPDGSYSRKIFQSHANPGSGTPSGADKCAHLNLTNIVSNPIPQNVLLNVRVRTMVNGALSDWGAACRFKVDVTLANCPATQLITTPGTTQSCGVTGKVVGASGATGRIYAQPAIRPVGGQWQSANYYVWEIKEPNSGYTRYAATTTYTLTLGAWNTNPLLCGTHTYNVRVRASFDGGTTYCPWGAVCTVGITNNNVLCTSPMQATADDRIFFDEEAVVAGTLSMWPNPNRGDELYLTLDQLDTELTTATMDLYDLFGKRVATYTLPVRDGLLNTSLDLNSDIASGMYLVTVIAGDQQFTQRLVIE